ncbi:hypothetical protein [Brevibacterium casei]|uniref:hypothetical protein n=1 Tax=Brevibacterium casei TaxID=33889 RepID=UPI00241E6FE2|nr:hypothetical protein [Brevibacterium casei]
MKKLLSFRSRGPDKRFGTGLWRHNHDRFLRAVDRYYATAVAIHEADAGVTSADQADPAGIGTVDADQAAASARELIMTGTHRLNDLATRIDELTERLHARWPIEDQVVPGHVRVEVGDTPEVLTRASAKVAEAVLAASMVRAETAQGPALSSAAAATDRYISDAADLLDRAQRTIAEAESR